MNANSTKIQQLLEESFPDASTITVHCDGNRCAVTIICSSFAHQKPVQRQQRVNACLKASIVSGEIHAVHIDARAPAD